MGSAAELTSTTETERKYETAGGAAEPSALSDALTGAGPVAAVTERDTVHLVAVYYDTPDERLAVDGVTLRRRTGGDDAGWHLKLPVTAGVREEIRAPLSESLPRALAALVRSRVRHAELGPVLTLRTERARHRLLDDDGRELAELALDRVTAERTSGGNGTARWSEVEVELAEGADPAVLDAVEQHLTTAGLRRSASPSKLHRALAETTAGRSEAAGPSGPAGRAAPAPTAASEADDPAEPTPAGIGTKASPATRPKPKAEGKPKKAKPKSKAESKPKKAKGKPKAEPRDKAKAEPKAGGKAGLKAEGKAKPKAEPAAENKAKDAKVEGKAGPNAGGKAKPKAEPAAESNAKDAKIEGNAGGKAREAKGRAKSEAEAAGTGRGTVGSGAGGRDTAPSVDARSAGSAGKAHGGAGRPRTAGDGAGASRADGDGTAVSDGAGNASGAEGGARSAGTAGDRARRPGKAPGGDGTALGADSAGQPGKAPGDTAGVHVLAYARRQLRAIIVMDPAARREVPDAVHQMRVATRRLRSCFRSYRAVLDRDVTAPLDGELRWLAAELGADRDREVLAERLATRLAELPPGLRRGPLSRRVRSATRAHRADTRRRVHAVLDSARYLALLDALVDVLGEEPPLRRAAGRPAGEVLEAAVRRDRRRLSSRVEEALALPPGPERDTAVHTARKAAKRGRYAAEAARRALGKAAKAQVAELTEVQEVLGEHQDSQLAREALLRIATVAQQAGEPSFSYGVLYEREAALAAASERELARLRP